MSADIVQFEKRLEGDAASIVECLQNLIEQAKRGEIDAIAIAAVDKDGGAWTITPPGDRFTHLIGALSVLQYKLLSRHCG